MYVCKRGINDFDFFMGLACMGVNLVVNLVMLDKIEALVLLLRRSGFRNIIEQIISNDRENKVLLELI
jgi:hypothetical protein